MVQTEVGKFTLGQFYHNGEQLNCRMFDVLLVNLLI